MTAYWPDGVPVHNRKIHVVLSCGHERVSRGWRGEVGQPYCCDACFQMATMDVVEETDAPLSGWT
jgi:hypothetical protein